MAAHNHDHASGRRCYYHHWLATLERMVAAKGLASEQSLAQHYQAWVRAMHRTPQGKPIKLKAQDFSK